VWLNFFNFALRTSGLPHPNFIISSTSILSLSARLLEAPGMPVFETIIISLGSTIAAIVIATKIERRAHYNRLYVASFTI
jgi:hypothetical protein